MSGHLQEAAKHFMGAVEFQADAVQVVERFTSFLHENHMPELSSEKTSDFYDHLTLLILAPRFEPGSAEYKDPASLPEEIRHALRPESKEELLGEFDVLLQRMNLASEQRTEMRCVLESFIEREQGAIRELYQPFSRLEEEAISIGALLRLRVKTDDDITWGQEVLDVARPLAALQIAAKKAASGVALSSDELGALPQSPEEAFAALEAMLEKKGIGEHQRRALVEEIRKDFAPIVRTDQRMFS